jgi:hypothetical protein
VNPVDSVQVYANVTDNVSGVKRVALNITLSNGTMFTVEMTNLEGNLYNGTIQQFPYNTDVTYMILAEDNLNNTSTTTDLGYEYQYTVISEFPTLIILPLFMILSLLAALAYRRQRT